MEQCMADRSGKPCRVGRTIVIRDTVGKSCNGAGIMLLVCILILLGM